MLSPDIFSQKFFLQYVSPPRVSQVEAVAALRAGQEVDEVKPATPRRPGRVASRIIKSASLALIALGARGEGKTNTVQQVLEPMVARAGEDAKGFATRGLIQNHEKAEHREPGSLISYGDVYMGPMSPREGCVDVITIMVAGEPTRFDVSISKNGDKIGGKSFAAPAGVSYGGVSACAEDGSLSPAEITVDIVGSAK